MRVEGRSSKKDEHTLRGYVLSGAAMALMIGIFAALSLQFAGRTGAREEDTLKKAITRASVQCYAIEGRYPPSVEYLEQNYGIQINREKYHVFYDGFASNVMPQITVIAAREQGDDGR